MSQSQKTIKPTFIPSEVDQNALLDWFALYETHVLNNDLDSMARIAVFRYM